MITDEDWIKAKSVDMKSLLDSYNIYSKNNFYKCPSHNEKTPSAKIGAKNILHCFGCGKTFDTIDIVRLMENVDHFEAIRKLIGSSIDPVRMQIEDGPIFDTPKYDYDFGISISKSLDKNNIGYIKDYLNKRCILNILSIADKLGIEIRHNYYKSKNYICYNFKDYNFIIQKALDMNSKKNFGSPVPIYFKINESNIWYITEGIEDCFSLILAHKYNVVCLNSISNVNKFTQAIKKKHNKNILFIIAVDNDGTKEKGKETGGVLAKNTLIKFFTENNIQYDLYHEFYNYAEKHKLKDINECFIHKKEMKKIDTTKI